MDKIKQIKNLFKKLIKDKNSVFYSADKINRTLLNKSRTSSYEKDKFLCFAKNIFMFLCFVFVMKKTS